MCPGFVREYLFKNSGEQSKDTKVFEFSQTKPKNIC
jgi:hypothetical protein